MRFGPRSRMTVETREEKQARLKAFIAQHVETLRCSGTAAETAYRVLTLSAESAAARALAELAPEICAAGIKVEAVFVRRTALATPEGAECRFVIDSRLLDAHEQLVLDATTVWIGDCMRRDPSRRDSYESYSTACTVTAGHAIRSFAHIWHAAGPSGSLTAGRKWASPRQPNLFDPSLLAGAETAPSHLPFRH